MFTVMYKKPTATAYSFSNPLSQADAERAAARYRRCGYDAYHVALPT